MDELLLMIKLNHDDLDISSEEENDQTLSNDDDSLDKKNTNRLTPTQTTFGKNATFFGNCDLENSQVGLHQGFFTSHDLPRH